MINPLDYYQNFINKIPLFNITNYFFNGAIQILFYNIDHISTAIKLLGFLKIGKIRNINKIIKLVYVIDDRNVKRFLRRYFAWR